MCVVSMIGDHYRDKWQPGWQQAPNVPINPFPHVFPTQDMSGELAKLKKEVEEMKELLKRAVKYDADNGQPRCENDEKIQFLRQVAEAVGLTIDDVFEVSHDDPLAQRPVGFKVTKNAK